MTDLPRLSWFPKPFSPGDTDGEGARRAMGAPSLDLASLLIREMAQNSWDARLPEGRTEGPPGFEVRMRILGREARQVLLRHVFTEVSPSSGLREHLLEPGCAVIEISDRGTKGLGGPDRIVANRRPGQLDDYARLVLTVGAPHAHGSTSGGTYGFGKTASYLASAHSTIVIWSRYRDERGFFQERFIASCMGDSFTRGGRRFTGRQWWALPRENPGSSEELSFRPATGNAAQQLGESIFEARFGPTETGTSVLIISPQLVEGENPLEGLEERVTAAMVRNLWPKLATDQPVSRRMDVQVWSGRSLVPVRSDSPVLTALQHCLDGIRSTQAGQAGTNPLVRVVEIRCGNPRALLGHLALTRVLSDRGEDPLRNLLGTVTYMRSEAELVVRSKTFPGLGADEVPWVGVFKPTLQMDPTFAAAEPPAHDDWAPEAVKDRKQRTFVNVALRRIREEVKEYLRPVQVQQSPAEGAATGVLSDALSTLAGGVGGSRAQREPRRRRGSRAAGRPKEPRVVVVEHMLLPNPDPGRQWTMVGMRVENAVRALVSPRNLGIAVEGGPLAAENRVRLEGWRTSQGDQNDSRPLEVEGEETIWAYVSFPKGLAVDVSFRAEVLP